MPDIFKPQTENLYRGLPNGLHLRDGDDDGETGGDGTADTKGAVMFGHFCVFNEWTEICSWYEGEFLERILPGAAKNTIRQHIDQMKVQYDHGQDDWVGSAPLGPIDILREDDIGGYYEVPLLDTDYNRDRVLPQLQGRLMDGRAVGSVLGSSFRFRVVKDAWNMEPKISAYNPKGLPERSIEQFTMFEFGPVVFPAYTSATAMASAGMRSLSDHYLERSRERRAKFAPVAPGTRDTADTQSTSGHSAEATGRSTASVTTQLLKLKGAHA